LVSPRTVTSATELDLTMHFLLVLTFRLFTETAGASWSSVMLFIQTLCFHLGMTDAFIWDYGQPTERWTTTHETNSILTEIHEEIVKDNRSLLYSHKVSAVF